MIRAKVIGASGYGGVGIIELLVRHPEVTIGSLVAVENVGTRISDLYPHLKGFCDLPISPPDRFEDGFDVTFMATPDRVGMKLAAAELAAGARVIDYSGDFRFNTAAAYAAYAVRIGLDPEHLSPALLGQSVYGLAELHRRELKPGTSLVGNPGCFAVSCILGLAPAVKFGMVRHDSIICDCKTGVSGAGKKLNASFHFPARYEQMNAYRLSGHQHVCEVERELGLLAGNTDLKVTFTAQVVPVCRGIMSTLYGTLDRRLSEADVLARYQEFYADSPFVRVLESTAPVGTMHVRGTNYCNLVISVDERTGRLRVVSYIDNLVKGQAGSALQNMNLLFGLDETAGMNGPGMYP
jgi:N-acetyl-gamma-glutamyl-phosphate reductase